MSLPTIPYTAPAPTPARHLRERMEASELMFYWRSVYRRKWWILAFAVLAAILAALALTQVIPTYRATVTLLVEQGRAQIVSIDEVYSGVSANREHYLTQAELLRSPALAANVIRKLGLTTHPEFDPRQAQPSFWRRTFVPGADREPAYWTEENVQSAVLAEFLRRVSVEPVRLSQLVKVGFDAMDPELAARIANTIAELFIQRDIDVRQGMTQNASNWLAERLIELKRTLDESESALQQYREREGMLDLQGLAQSGASRQIEVLSLAAEEARQRRSEAEIAYRQIKSGGVNLHAHPVVLGNPVVERMKGLEAEAERRLGALAGRYGPDHVRMVQAEKDLVQARTNTRRAVEAAVASFAKEYEVASANERAVQRSLSSAKSSVQNINRREFRLEALERDVATNRQIYERFLNRYKETSAVPAAQTGVVARVIDPAIPPGLPYKPPKQRIIQAAFLLALLLGIVAAVLRERVDNTIRSAEDVEEKLGLQTVAVLPLLPSHAGRAAGRHYLDEPSSPFSEAVRTARTSILLSSIDEPSKVLLVTSSLPGEGKSAFAINLALAHAQTKKVLLLEADLRRPSIADHLGLDRNKPGLADLFAGTARFLECVQRVEGSTLYILPCGSIAPDPTELIASERFKLLLERLSAACDIVVVDSPPIHLVSDAVVLSTMVTDVLFVVQADSTPYPVARRAIRALEGAGASMLGAILNQFDASKADRYQGAYAGYVKDYGYVGPVKAT